MVRCLIREKEVTALDWNELEYIESLLESVYKREACQVFDACQQYPNEGRHVRRDPVVDKASSYGGAACPAADP